MTFVYYNQSTVFLFEILQYFQQKISKNTDKSIQLEALHCNRETNHHCHFFRPEGQVVHVHMVDVELVADEMYIYERKLYSSFYSSQDIPI